MSRVARRLSWRRSRLLSRFRRRCSPLARATRRRGPRPSPNLNDFSFDSMDVEYDARPRRRRHEHAPGRRDVRRASSRSTTRTAACGAASAESYLGVPLNPELVSITDGEGNRARVRDRVRGRRTSRSPRAPTTSCTARRPTSSPTRWRTSRASSTTPASTSSTGTSTAPSGSSTFGRVIGARDDVRPISPTRSTGAQACYVGYQGSADTCEIVVGCAADGIAAFEASPNPCFAVPDHDDRGRIRGGHVRAVRLVVPGVAVGVAAAASPGSGCWPALVFADRHARAHAAR